MAGEEAIVSGMAGRYATALFELAREQNAIDTIKVNLDRFDAMVAEIADLARLLRSPVFSADEQSRALSAVLDKIGIDGLAANFLKLVATNRRLFAARDMVKRLPGAGRQAQGRGHRRGDRGGEAERGAPRRHQGCAHGHGRKDVDMDIKIDPSIIGGLVVKLGCRMVDTSLRTKLNAIKLAMKEAR